MAQRGTNSFPPRSVGTTQFVSHYLGRRAHRAALHRPPLECSGGAVQKCCRILVRPTASSPRPTLFGHPTSQPSQPGQVLASRGLLSAQINSSKVSKVWRRGGAVVAVVLKGGRAGEGCANAHGFLGGLQHPIDSGLSSTPRQVALPHSPHYT
ncbi:hypothetical protein E2C01_083046 [Portunus trituberculatus]|uniref:Uncharacterized protein n=1 Tax=Portunus trituberculatus TaxID=210409 RepID=A0A5B7IW54_PORTR|nr:hypothetical protein [Portunus trituberculatus]